MKAFSSFRCTVVGALVSSALLAGCAPLLVGGAAVGGMLVFTDRRTSGTQLEDQAIELKAMNRARETTGERTPIERSEHEYLRGLPP